jgi:dimethylamine corrinoid protein
MAEETLLKQFENAVKKQDIFLLEKAFREAASSPLSTGSVLRAMIGGLDVVRMGLNDHSVSVPEFLIAVDVLKDGLAGLGTLPSAGKGPGEAGKVVIGVVEGDIHELGKNIIAGVLAVSGYTVFDLGRDVSADRFIEKVKESRASILALSAMMSTPLENMRRTVERCKREVPGVYVIVGGAALDRELAEAYGADGYAESVVTVLDELRSLQTGDGA